MLFRSSFFFLVKKMGVFMVVFCLQIGCQAGVKFKPFCPIYVRELPSPRMPTNKSPLVARIEPELVRWIERTLPAEPNHHWQFFISKHIEVVCNFLFFKKFKLICLYGIFSSFIFLCIIIL